MFKFTVEQREAFDGYLFMSVGALGLLLMIVGPVVASFAISFTEWPILRAPRFVGLDNYRNMISDAMFWQSLKVTATYVGTAVPLGIVFAFSVALLMNQGVKGIAFWRTIYYMPAIVSGVVMVCIWSWLFSPDFGLINDLLARIGIRGPGWLNSSDWALPTLILMSLWTAGGSMVIYLAGLQSVPTALYDAASIDGANAWRRFWHVTVPMMTPVLLFQLVMGVIGSFQAFTPAYVATQGGPANSTFFYNYYLYLNAFRDFKMGYASSQAWVLFLIIIVFTIVIISQSGNWVYYEGGNDNGRG